MDDIKQHPRYEEARRHAQDVRGFYTHLVIYILVNAGLIAMNFLEIRTRIWFGWPLLGWGIGLAAHGLWVFAFSGWLGPQWEERKIREYLDRQ